MDRIDYGWGIEGWVGMLILLVIIFTLSLTFIAVYTNLELDFFVPSIVFGIFLIYLTYMDVIDPIYSVLGLVIISLIIVCIRMEAKSNG